MSSYSIYRKQQEKSQSSWVRWLAPIRIVDGSEYARPFYHQSASTPSPLLYQASSAIFLSRSRVKFLTCLWIQVSPSFCIRKSMQLLHRQVFLPYSNEQVPRLWLTYPWSLQKLTSKHLVQLWITLGRSPNFCENRFHWVFFLPRVAQLA